MLSFLITNLIIQEKKEITHYSKIQGHRKKIGLNLQELLYASNRSHFLLSPNMLSVFSSLGKKGLSEILKINSVTG